MERRHSGAVSTAVRVSGGGGEAEGPGNLGQAEGAPDPTAHGRLDWNAFSGAATETDPPLGRARAAALGPFGWAPYPHPTEDGDGEGARPPDVGKTAA